MGEKFFYRGKRKFKISKCLLCNEEFERRAEAPCHKHCRKCSYKIAGEKKRGAKRGPISEEVREKRAKAIAKKYPKVTIDCEYCSKPFVVNYGRRNTAKYCSRNCQWKGNENNRVRGDSRKNKKCLVCNADFKTYADNITCSRKCSAIYMSKIRIGENNPNYKQDSFSKAKCPTCKKIFQYGRDGLGKGRERLFCSKECSCKAGGGKHIKDKEKYQLIDNENIDKKIIYKSNYPNTFNDNLKNKIKKRDSEACIMCGAGEKLEVHHIDYDKKNCEEENLITLCKKCHTLTNFNRYFWQQVFIGLGSQSKIVKKGWGLEIHFVNHKDYCLKYLIFFKNKKFSFHEHNVKKELWVCNWGKFECRLKDKNGIESIFIFKTGDKLELEPEVVHQLYALTNCIIMEVSTRDYPEDSIRLEKGD